MFDLTGKEYNKYCAWQLEHKKKCPIKNVGAIGGRETFCFTPTSLGVIIIVKCACGDEITLTDFENW